MTTEELLNQILLAVVVSVVVYLVRSVFLLREEVAKLTVHIQNLIDRLEKLEGQKERS